MTPTFFNLLHTVRNGFGEIVMDAIKTKMQFALDIFVKTKQYITSYFPTALLYTSIVVYCFCIVFIVSVQLPRTPKHRHD